MSVAVDLSECILCIPAPGSGHMCEQWPAGEGSDAGGMEAAPRPKHGCTLVLSGVALSQLQSIHNKLIFMSLPYYIIFTSCTTL